jgi:O-antigen/teichoic acid export membrane protein
MPAKEVESPSVSADAHRATFFRQSGWLMIANIAGGVLMWGVHFLSKKIPPAEYGVFGTMLAVAMCIPTMPLQMVFAQQTAKALATKRERELAGMIRLVWLGTFGVWLVSSAAVLFWQGRILERMQIANPVGLWITLVVVLLSLWVPMFSGVLQGQQNFLWLGWTMMINGAGRLLVAAFVVLVLAGFAAGLMTGVLLGLVVAAAIAIWQTRTLWLMPSSPFDWRSLLKQVIPLMLGFGAFQFMFTADTMFVKAYFTGDETGFYVSAGTLSRALMWLVGPMAAVMFPRIVHSAVKAEKTDLMGVVLIGTLVLAAGGALGLCILGPWVVRFVYSEAYVKIATSVMPWYAGAMVPLSLANVLINNLLARSHFRVVPALVVLAAAYAFALTQFHDSLVTVLKTMGVCNLLLLGICAWFTWGIEGKSPKSEVRS